MLALQPVGAPKLPLVLLVDDHDDSREILAEYLGLCGFSLHTAANGEEAIEVALRARPAVIVMDLAMPVMDGWEATRRLRALPETRGIPIVGLTAYGDAEARRRALEAGCDEVLTKPVEPARLEERLRRYCRPPPEVVPTPTGA